MSRYGEFTDNINTLDRDLDSVRTVWTDQTAITYDSINDNMKVFASKITALFGNAEAGFNAVKANYDESQFEDTIGRLSAKVVAV